jgi:hypothetical protein
MRLCSPHLSRILYLFLPLLTHNLAPNGEFIMPEESSDSMLGYHSFLIRLWVENDDLAGNDSAHPIWRASLEDPRSDQLFVFSGLRDLCNYLESLIEAPIEGDDK